MCAHYAQHGDLFQKWELEVVETLIWEFWPSPRLRAAHEKEDLRQECLSHWCEVRNSYSQSRGASPRTYMTKVIRNKLLELLRYEEADLRRVNTEASPFSSPLGSEQEMTVEDEANEAGVQEDDSFEEARVREILSSLDLTDREVEILDLLSKGYRKTEIAKKVGASRDTVYEDMKRIRKLFEDKGLRKFLE